MLRVILFYVLLTMQAHAGAWPREKGKTFLSFSVESEQSSEDGRVRTLSTLYLEHGLTDRLTLGVDMGGDTPRMSKAILFLRYPLNGADKKTKLAFELGFGRANDRSTLQPGLSAGRGVKLGKRFGWVAVDTRYNLTDTKARRSLEADFTFGINATRKSKLILQLQTGFPSQSPPYVKIAPSWVVEKRPGRHVELGMTVGVKEVSTISFKYGIWRHF